MADPAALAGGGDGVYDAVIIGGGVAGLTALRELLARGVRRVLLLEAGDRLGGRVYTVDAASPTRYELGATWLHGASRNPLYAFAAEAGLLHAARGYMTDAGSDAGGDDGGAPPGGLPWPLCAGGGGALAPPAPAADTARSASSAVAPFDDLNALCFDYAAHDGELLLRPGGRAVRPTALAAVSAAVDASLLAASRCLGDARVPEGASVGGLVAAHLGQAAGGTGGPGAEAVAASPSLAALPPALAGALYEARHVDECLYTGADGLGDVSLRWFGAYDLMDGSNTPPPGGFGSLVHALAAPGVAAGAVATGKRVVRVAAGGNGGEGGGQGCLTVACDDGSAVSARAVIATVSLGVLKAAVSAGAGERGGDGAAAPLFSPPLPPPKAAAIARQGFGRVEKVHLEYPAPWWRGAFGWVGPPPLPRGGGGGDDDDDVRERECFGFVFAWDRHLVRGASGGGDCSSGEGGPGGGAGAVPASAPPPVPFPDFAPWMGRVYGAFEDAGPRPQTAPPFRLTFWLYGDAADAVDPPADGGGGRGGGGPPPPSMSDAALAWHLTRILQHFVAPAATPPAAAGGGSGCADDPEAAWTLGWLAPPAAAWGGGRELPRPTRLVRSRWGADPLFRGSYSYTPAGGRGPEDIAAIAAPLTPVPAAAAEGGGDGGAGPLAWAPAATDPLVVPGGAEGGPPTAQPPPLPLLCFAGEATHARFYSATHGAFASGVREAARVAAALRGGARARRGEASE